MILVYYDIQVDTLPHRGPSGQQYSNPLAVNRCLKRYAIPWTLNLGCAKSLELAMANETAIKAKKQVSEGTPFNDDDHDLRVCTWNIRTPNRDGASAQLGHKMRG